MSVRWVHCRVVGVVGFVALGLVVSASSAGAAAELVSYCHRTADVTNPYVLHTTDADSILKQGHGDHTGPIFPNEGPDGKWGDVIPPFDSSDGHYPGMNWPEGQAVIDAACVVHEIVPPDETTTTTAVTTTSAPTSTAATSTTTASGSTTSVVGTSTSTTSTSLPVSSTTSTTAVGPTTTEAAHTETIPTTVPGATTVPAETPHTSPPTTAVASEVPPPLTLPPSGELETVQAVVVTPGGNVVILGQLNDRQRQVLKALLVKRIANTGSASTDLTIGAAIALLTGAVLVVVAARGRAREGPPRLRI